MPNKVKSVAAANNSTCSAPSAPTIKGVAINNHNKTPQNEWVRLRQRDLHKAMFSEFPEMYLVRIDGVHRNVCTSVSKDDITVELLYEDIHPYLAIGRAVIDFMNNKIAAQIHDIYICKRTIKKKKSHK